MPLILFDLCHKYNQPTWFLGLPEIGHWIHKDAWYTWISVSIVQDHLHQ